MKTLLVAVDFSDVTDSVIEATYAQAVASRAVVRVVHAASPEPDFVGYGAGPLSEITFQEEYMAGKRKRLEELVNALKERGVDSIGELIVGPSVDVLLDEIKKHSIEMLIVGSHGHGALFNLVVGSVTSGLLHRARIPVLVVPSRKD